MYTHKSELVYGIEYEGVEHVDFEIRETTIRDSINAVDKMVADGEDIESNNLLRFYLAAEQIISIGNIPKEMITAKLLLSMPEDNYVPISVAQDEVAKKRKDAKKSSSPT